LAALLEHQAKRHREVWWLAKAITVLCLSPEADELSGMMDVYIEVLEAPRNVTFTINNFRVFK
jgi:hypothetical protein